MDYLLPCIRHFILKYLLSEPICVGKLRPCSQSEALNLAHKIHTVHKQHGKVFVSADLISIIGEFPKLKALAQVQIVAMRVRHIVTHVRATPLGLVDHACQTRKKKVSVQLVGVSRVLVGKQIQEFVTLENMDAAKNRYYFFYYYYYYYILVSFIPFQI